MEGLRSARLPARRLPPIVRSWPVQLTAICSLAFYQHALLWWTEPRDLELYLGPWFQHIVSNGPIGAFSHPFSNYTPPYLYLLALASLAHQLSEPVFLIKLLSFAGNLFAAFAVADLIKTCGGSRRYAVLLFVVPSFVINAALLAQCDAIWAGACVLAVSAMIGGKPTKSLVWCGVAIAFKAQAVFIAPFIIGALAGHRKSPWHWLIPPMVFVGAMLPAWMAGWPAWDLALVYPAQASWGDFPGRLANPWIIGTVYAPVATREFYWVGLMAAAIISVAIAVQTSKAIGNPRVLLLLALLSSIALPFFLPKMLERYFFLAGLLSVTLALSYSSRATIFIAVAIEAASFLSLLTYMYFFADPYPTLIGFAFATAALVTNYIQIMIGRGGCPQRVEDDPSLSGQLRY